MPITTGNRCPHRSSGKLSGIRSTKGMWSRTGRIMTLNARNLSPIPPRNGSSIKMSFRPSWTKSCSFGRIRGWICANVRETEAEGIPSFPIRPDILCPAELSAGFAAVPITASAGKTAPVRSWSGNAAIICRMEGGKKNCRRKKYERSAKVTGPAAITCTWMKESCIRLWKRSVWKNIKS